MSPCGSGFLASWEHLNSHPFAKNAKGWGTRRTLRLRSGQALGHGAVPYLWHKWHNASMKQQTVRTTVDIPAPLYRRLKEQAAAQGRSVRELLLAGAQSVLLQGRRSRANRVQ